MSTAVTDGADVSRTLAEFIAGSQYEDIPEPVRHEARRSLLNFFATAFSGCRDPALDIALGSLSEFGAPGDATVIGRPERVDPLSAAFLNAAAANVYDYDDTHLRTVIHPAAPVVPALLALSERRGVTGQQMIHALALGIETECRIGNAISPEHYNRGWHITATCGVFGAAMAVGKALGLDDRRLVWALGTASAQASGSGVKTCNSLTPMPPIWARPFEPTMEREASKSSGRAAVVDSSVPTAPDAYSIVATVVSSTSISAPRVRIVALTRHTSPPR